MATRRIRSTGWSSPTRASRATASTLETIGRYNPQLDPSLIEIDTDRARDWIAKGAQPTEQVAKLLKIAGMPPPPEPDRWRSCSPTWPAQLVDDPDQVRVERLEREDGELVLELHVAPDDVGKVIGKQGRIARALRTVVKASAVRTGRRVHVEIAA